MHTWGNWPDESFQQVEQAAYYIGSWLSKWARIPVGCTKEKFGTARVYCSFGWSSLYSIYRPRYYWVASWWPYKLDLWLSYKCHLINGLNRLAIPLQKRLYRLRYQQALKKWPHLREEILDGADWIEELQGL